MLSEALQHLEGQSIATRKQENFAIIGKPVRQPLGIQRKLIRQLNKGTDKVKNIDKKLKTFDQKLRPKAYERQARIDARTERMQEHGRAGVRKFLNDNLLYRFMVTPWMSQETRISLNKQRAVLP